MATALKAVNKANCKNTSDFLIAIGEVTCFNTVSLGSYCPKNHL